MPYGAQVKKLDEVFLEDGLKLAVHPDVMKMLDLKPGQKVDVELGKKIIEENDRLERFK